MSIKNLVKILDEIDYPVFMEIIDCIWYKDSAEVYWNTQDSKEDLSEREGETYSSELLNGETIYDGYLVVNGDTGCGETVTYFFNLEKEVSFD